MTRLLVVLVWLAACGGDGVHHLPDAPPGVVGDGAIDATTDSGPDDVHLQVALGGTGTGTITSSPAGISCGTSCDAAFARHTHVTLTAMPATGSVFVGWSGACSGALPTCDLALADLANVTATFDLAKFTVTIVKSGVGTGTVSGGGLACGATCAITVDSGTALSLSAAPVALSSFAGWGGACSGMGTCDLVISGDTTITANFALDDVTLFVTRGGNGTGTVTSAPAGITCGTDCMETYTANQMVTLTAVPATGSTFTGWSGGGCSGTGTCTLTMTAATTVTATFTLQTHTLTVVRAGTGTGNVSSVPAGIACGTDCTEVYNYGTMVTLTATASIGSSFTGWTGACTGAGPCVIAITAAATATATFTLDTFVLTVARAGNGTGTITGTGITCGTDCTEPLAYGTMEALTATPATGSHFAGWSGACSGMGACVVTIDAAKSVTATFTLDTFVLTVADAGTGSGTITGTGITCGTDCTETLDYNTVEALTATPATGSTFTGWSGACSGTGACSVTMTVARSVTATFTLNTFALDVSRLGNGMGTITGTGITCGTDCTEVFPYNTMVSLTATPTPNTGSTFTGWGGGCSGTGACTVTMDMARSVTATFTLIQVTLTVGPTGTGAGSITGTGIACPSGCATTVNYGTSITLTATPSAANATLSTFTGWSGGGCAGTGTCTVMLTVNTTVTAGFTLKPNIIFVTKQVSNGSLGGLVGADKTCNTSAAAANLPGNYVAYLSSINSGVAINAPTRVGSASGWVRVDGKPVMNKITEFTGGALFNPPSLDEGGTDVNTTQYPYVWTGTSPQGMYQNACSAPAATIVPWAGPVGSANVGLAGSTTATAVDMFLGGCDVPNYRLYCLGIDRAAIAQ